MGSHDLASNICQALPESPDAPDDARYGASATHRRLGRARRRNGGDWVGGGGCGGGDRGVDKRGRRAMQEGH